MVFRHDDRPLIPRNNIRFVNDQIGYIFMESMYAVTTDAGKPCLSGMLPRMLLTGVGTNMVLLRIYSFHRMAMEL